METQTHNPRYARSFRRFGRKVLKTLLVFVVLLGQLGPYTSYMGAKPASAAASIPKLLNYQARITDDAGVPVPDGNLNIWISVYDAPSGGSCLYAMRGSCGTPSYKTVTVSSGVFSMLIGDTASGDNEIDDDLFDGNSLYLGVTVASDTEMVPRKRITAAPYAFNADRLDDLDVTSSGSDTASIVALTSNGNLVVTGDPQGGAVSAGSVYVNPGSASASETLFGIADNGSSRWSIDKEGDVAHTGSLLATAASSTAQFVFRGAASQSNNIFEVQDSLSNRMLAVSATATSVGSTSSTDAVIFNSRVGSNFTPTTDAAFDLGDYNRRWRDLWLSGGSAKIALDQSGTSVLSIGFETSQGLRGVIKTPDNIPLQIRSGNSATAGVTVATDGSVTIPNLTVTSCTGCGGGASTLQEAYDNDADGSGATITTNSTDGDLIIAGSQELVFNSTGDVLFDGTTFVVDTSTNRVGIGELVPDTNLHVTGSAAGASSVMDASIILENTSSGESALIQRNSLTGSSMWFTGLNESTNYSFAYGTSYIDDNYQFRLDPAGTAYFGDVSSTADRNVTIIGLKDAGISLLADSNDSTEDDNAYILFSQDNGTVSTITGLTGSAGFDPLNASYTNALANAYLIGGRNASSTVQFGTNGAVRLTIDSSGDVGIGTNAPAQDLEISRTGSAVIRVNGDSDNVTETDVAQIQLTQDGGISTAYWGMDGNTANDMVFAANSTTNPDIRFETASTGTSYGGTARMTIFNAGDVTIGDTQTQDGQLTIRQDDAADIFNLYDGASNVFTVRDGGNVGIGNLAPANRLTVGSTTSTFEVNGAGNIVKINNVVYSWPSTQGGASTFLQNNGSGTLSWVSASGLVNLNQAYLSSTSSNELYVTPSQGALTIADAIGGNANIFEIQDRTNAAGDYSQRYLTVSSTSTNVDTGTFVVDHANNRVGIGVAVPLSKLHVSGGDIRVDVNTTIFANGTGALNIGDSSDTVNVGNGTLYALGAAGNAGVGISAPTARLSVADANATPTVNVFEVGNASLAQKYLTTSSTATLIGISTFGYEVGIGQSTPTARLHVTPDANMTALQISGFSTTGTDALANIAGTWNTAGAPVGVLVNITDTSSSGNATLLTMQQSSVTRYNFRKDGRQTNTGNSANTVIASGFVGLDVINSNLTANNLAGIGFGDGAGTAGSGIMNQFLNHSTDTSNLIFATTDNAGTFATRLTVGATTTSIVGDLSVSGTITGNFSQTLNQAYLNSTSTTEIYLTGSRGALTVADTFSGTGNIFEVQNRTNAAGDYSTRYFTVSSTSTNINCTGCGATDRAMTVTSDGTAVMRLAAGGNNPATFQLHRNSSGNNWNLTVDTVLSEGLAFRFNNTEHMRIGSTGASAGNLALGTTDTAPRFNLRTASDSITGNIVQFANASDSVRYLTVSSTATQISGDIIMGRGSGANEFQIYDTNNNNYLRLYPTAQNNFQLDLEGATSVGDLTINQFLLGIGNTNPASLLTVGSGTSTFEVDGTGNLVKVNNVVYSWPSSQGGASTVLTNNGSGVLTWAAAGGGSQTLLQAFNSSTSTDATPGEIYLNSTTGAFTIADNGNLDDGSSDFSGLGTNLFEIVDRTTSAGHYDKRYFWASATGVGITGGLEFRQGGPGSNTISSPDGDLDLLLDGGTGTLTATGNLSVTGGVTLGSAGADSVTWNASTWTVNNALNMSLGSNKWSITSTSGVSNAIEVIGNSISSAALIAGTANGLTSGRVQWWTSSSAFSGNMFDLGATGAATGDFIELTSTNASATARAINIDFDNGNNNNVVFSLVSDETSVSGTSADTEKFAILASGSIRGDGNLTFGSSSSTNVIDFSGARIGSNLTPTTDDAYDLGDHNRRWRDLWISGGTVHIGDSQSDEGTIAYNASSNKLVFGASGGVSITDLEVTGTCTGCSGSSLSTLFTNLPFEGAAIGSASHTQVVSVSSQESGPKGVFFRPEGTSMYVIGTDNGEVHEYDISPAWDVTSANYSNSFSVFAQEENPSDVYFKSDGTMMFVIGTSDIEVNAYTLSTPWDLSTLSQSATFSVSSQETAPTGLTFKPDGTMMFVTGTSGDDVNAYTLSTAWDITTATFDQAFAPTYLTVPQGIAFNEDGTVMYLTDDLFASAIPAVVQYELSTAWDISTTSIALVTGVYESVSSQNSDPTGAYVDPERAKLYVVGATTPEVNEYEIGYHFDASLSLAGRVGIGTVSPSAELDVNGRIRATDVIGFNSEELPTGNIALDVDYTGTELLSIGLRLVGSMETAISVGEGDVILGGFDGASTLSINTSFPSYTFDANNDIADYLANFFNDGNAASRQGIRIQACTDSGSDATCEYAAFFDGNGTKSGRIRDAGGDNVAYATTAAGDFGERLPGDPAILTDGYLLALDAAGSVTKAAAGSPVIGVANDQAVFVGNDGLDPATSVMTSLLGLADAYVSVENGPIKAGDLITVSSVAGVGMKSTKPGMVVGRAMEAWNGPGQGKIQVYVNAHWNAALAITSDGIASQFNDDFSFLPPAYADDEIQAVNSRELSFIGSAWDSGSSTSVTRQISLKTEISAPDAYQFSFRNDDGNLLAALNQSGDLSIAGTLSVEGGFDYAEMFPAVPDIEAGDIVMVDPDDANGYGVKKTQGAYENSAIGVISTKPGFLTGDRKQEGAQPVALAGRVPVKVNDEGGEILPGDPITSSSVPGVGMKATEAGRVIGIALQRKDADGKVLIFVNPSWWNGPMPVAGTMAEGTLSISQDSLLDFKNSVLSNVAAIISTNGAWGVTSDGHLVAQKLEAKDVAAETFTVKAVAEMPERTVGVGRIKAGYDAVLVPNAKVKPDSLIVVTFEGNPGANWWIDEKLDGHFVLKLAQGAHMDLKFTYWIVPIEGALEPESDADGSATGTEETPPPPDETESGTGTPETGGETESGSGTGETP